MTEYTHTWLEIEQKAIQHNIRQFQRLVGKNVAIMPIVKSNAYGHGMVEVAKICTDYGVDWLGVVNLSEALKLRQTKIKTRILVLSYLDDFKEINQALQQNIDLAVYDLKTAQQIAKRASRLKRAARIHVKIDTGTSRLGILYHQGLEFIKKVNKLPNLKINGLFTHYAASEENQPYTYQQTKRFNQLIRETQDHQIEIPLKHASCSASAMVLPNSYFNLIRLGISLYGLWPSKLSRRIAQRNIPWLNLKPALTWKTKIIQIKTLPQNTPIGYGCTYKTKKKTNIAILPVGYWEGFDRHLSNKGEVLVHGQRCPIRGRVCMNLTMVELGNSIKARVGDEVTLIGSQGKESLSADDLAEKIGTINYEIVTRINPILPRIII